jgi:hypothetical protein
MTSLHPGRKAYINCRRNYTYFFRSHFSSNILPGFLSGSLQNLFKSTRAWGYSLLLQSARKKPRPSTWLLPLSRVTSTSIISLIIKSLCDWPTGKKYALHWHVNSRRILSSHFQQKINKLACWRSTPCIPMTTPWIAVFSNGMCHTQA